MKAKTLWVVVLVLLGVACLTGRAAAQGLRPGDSFELKISGVPLDDSGSISGTYTVDNDGYINISYLNKVKVLGKSSGDIQSMIEGAYRSQQIFTHPTIVLTFQQGPGRGFVNVSGAVKNPSRIPYTPDMTIMSAITAANDFNEYAKQTAVQWTHGGKVEVINCKRIRQDPSLDRQVSPGDSIRVPESWY